jgi:hypothetical protein
MNWGDHIMLLLMGLAIIGAGAVLFEAVGYIFGWLLGWAAMMGWSDRLIRQASSPNTQQSSAGGADRGKPAVENLESQESAEIRLKGLERSLAKVA